MVAYDAKHCPLVREQVTSETGEGAFYERGRRRGGSL
ncbi:hypothetical protein [Bradyrhizobium sp. AZCC 2262]